jgi:multiple sugar transport system substrate-binding protein
VAYSSIRVALAGGDRFEPLHEARLPRLTEDTGIPVEVVPQLPAADLTAHLGQALSTGAGCDLVATHSRYVAGLAPHLAPLEELLSPEELAPFSEIALASCRWQGRLYGLPRSVETRLLYYRTDIFDDRQERRWFAEASEGQELRVPRSWEELAAIAQYFTRTGKMHGFAFPGRGPGLVALFAEILTTIGGTFFDAEAQPRFFSRAGEWTLTLLRDLYGRWAAVPPETPELEEDAVSELFRLGRCAMVCDYPDVARLLGDPTFSAVPGWHGVALYPTGPAGRRAVLSGCPAFAIPADTQNAEAAAALLRFLTAPEAQKLEAKHGALPSRDDTYMEVKEGLREGTLGHLRFTLAEQSLQDAITLPAVPQYANIEARLWPLLQDAITGKREVVPALEEANGTVQDLLSVQE